MDEQRHLPPERIFGNVTHIMAPKWTNKTGKKAWEKVYGSYIREYFSPSAESALWVLWLRKPN